MNFSLEEIKEQVSKVISYSQDIPEPKIDKLINDWIEAKRNFIEVMDGNLIYEFPERVSFELSEEAKNQHIDNFKDFINGYNYEDLAKFIDRQRNGFFSNQVVKEDFTPAGEKIPKGMKLIKSFKFFVNNDKILHDFQAKASEYIQKNKIEGKLCLSVHPLDFLSASENVHNWRSCHSLDGDYRAGNLTYMVDKSTVMCYLRADDETNLPDFPPDLLWNSKKWRMWLFFSEDWKIIFAGRQYPFSTDVGLDVVSKKLLPSTGLYEWSNWCTTKISEYVDAKSNTFIRLSGSYIPIGTELVKIQDFIKENPGNLGYNDLLYSSCYTPAFAFKKTKIQKWNWFSENPIMEESLDFSFPSVRIQLGGYVNCCRCGEKHLTLPETFMCKQCEIDYGTSDSDYFSYCACCGERFVTDDGYWVTQEDEFVCPDCYDENVVQCVKCGDTLYKNNANWSDKLEDYICNCCRED